LKKEKLPIKTVLKTGAIMGLAFAGTMAAFDWFDGKSFSILKFCLQFLIFGGIMALFNRYKPIKK